LNRGFKNKNFFQLEVKMLERFKPGKLKLGDYILKISYLFLIGTLLYLIPGPAQDDPYWMNAPVNGIKIFTISFTDNQNGKAVSVNGELLITEDGGNSWKLKNNVVQAGLVNDSPFIWKADINCSVMLSSDSGSTWNPYEKEKQDHFCYVYLKDENSGYKVVAEFLSKASKIIIENYNNNEIELLTDHPQQCTEYFVNAAEGWALGWCLKNFVKKNISVSQ
jgi:hypothetical protein